MALGGTEGHCPGTTGGVVVSFPAADSRRSASSLDCGLVELQLTPAGGAAASQTDVAKSRVGLRTR